MDEIKILLQRIEQLEKKQQESDNIILQLKDKLNNINSSNTKTGQLQVNDEKSIMDKINELINDNNELFYKISDLMTQQKTYKTSIQSLQQQLNTLSDQSKEQFKKINDYLDHIDDSLDENDVLFKDLSEENQALLQGLIRMKQEFDFYIESSIKEKVFGAASLTVLTILLLQNNLIDNEQYLSQLNIIMKQIIDVYKKEGLDINFDDVLNNEFDSSSIAMPVTNIPMSAIKNMKKNIHKKLNTQDNVITLQDTLKKKKDSTIQIAKSKETKNIDNNENLFNLFNNNLISEINNKPKKNNRKKKKKDDNN